MTPERDCFRLFLPKPGKREGEAFCSERERLRRDPGEDEDLNYTNGSLIFIFHLLSWHRGAASLSPRLASVVRGRRREESLDLRAPGPGLRAAEPRPGHSDAEVSVSHLHARACTRTGTGRHHTVGDSSLTRARAPRVAYVSHVYAQRHVYRQLLIYSCARACVREGNCSQVTQTASGH